MKGCVALICFFLAVKRHSLVTAEETNSEEDSCENALQHSSVQLKRAATTIGTLTNSLEAAAHNLRKAEEDLNLVVFGSRTLYDKNTDEYESIMCEFRGTQISCPEQKKIKIISADYGRHDHKTCFHTEIYTTNCSSNKTLPYITQTCNSQTSCRVSANYKIFGDPCVYTHKYLKVIFKCE